VTARRGDWFQTSRGERFWPLDPRVEDVHIEDIAHALSRICRFGGHCEAFYSVAQHSYLVSFLVPEQLALHGLLHDAAEAYCGDMVEPMKRCLREKAAGARLRSDFDQIEAGIELVIARRFGLAPLTDLQKGAIKAADLVALATERRDLMSRCDYAWDAVEHVAPDEEPITACGPAAAHELFMDRWRQLTRGGVR